jgi:hypothetical protein
VWQFKPIKKSINWAIWRKMEQTKTHSKDPPVESPPRRRRRRRQRQNTIDGDQPPAPSEERKFNLKDKLESVGMEEVVPGGRCEGGQIQKGTLNVTKGGMYALVFG